MIIGVISQELKAGERVSQGIIAQLNHKTRVENEFKRT
jgi:hypothetical protein